MRPMASSSSRDANSFDGLDNPLLSDDPRIWEQLVDAVAPASILVAIRHRLGPDLARRLSAEDVWQDTLLHVWRDRARLSWQGLRAFRQLLLAVAENRIRDAVDRERAQKRDAGRDRDLGGAASAGGPGSTGSLPPTLCNSTTPSKIAMLREHAERMSAVLAELDDECRDVVRLRLIEDMDVPAIAQRLELGVDAVRYRLRRGSEHYQRELRRAYHDRDPGTRKGSGT